MRDYFSNLPEVYDGARKGDDNLPEPSPPSQIPVTPETAAIMGIADITKETIRCFTDYMKCKEHEQTERTRIKAELRAIQYQIDAKKEVYLKTLDQDYKERNRLYDVVEKVQDWALETGDSEMVKYCFNVILNIRESSQHSGGSMPKFLDISSSFL